MDKMKIEYDFVPQHIVVGKSKADSDCAFVTCRYKHSKWKNASVFERICGYKPHAQRDPEMELKKALCNAVSCEDNIPAYGFSFVGYSDDIYGLYYANFKVCTNVVLRDPRGFNVAVTANNFWYMMKCAGNNMKNGVIDHKFAYAWSASSMFMLVDAESREFKECKDESSMQVVDGAVEHITASNLEVGKVYLTSDNLEVVYLGKHDTYSNMCHFNAYSNHRYDVDKYSKSKTDLTGKDRHVFYVLGVTFDASWAAYVIPSRKAHCSPYVAKSSIGSYIREELPASTMNKHKMHNSDTAVTYSKITEDMEHSMFFNKLDFSKSDLSEEDLDLEQFISEFGYSRRCMHVPFPFNSFDRSSKIYTHAFGCVCIDAYKTAIADKNDYIVARASSNNVIAKYNSITLMDLYMVLRPYVKTFYLENGNKVDQFVARCLLPSGICY